MTAPINFSRRLFLAELGRGTVALAVVGIAGCAPAGSSPSGGASPRSAAASSAASPNPSSGSPEPPASDSPPAGSPAAPGGGMTWERVDLGFVSAYVLARAGEAAVVDTGTAGSEDDIAAALERIGLGWDAVGHVIATHLHNDHVGSLPAVLEAAPDATGYAGPEDLPSISSPRPLVAVNDGDDVFGLRIIGTPGHTPGSISVLDAAGGILVVGDAMGTSNGAVQGSNPQFTADMDAAVASVAKLGTFEFETLLVGHGDPIVGGASDLVAAYRPS